MRFHIFILTVRLTSDELHFECHNRTFVIAGRRLCDTCSNQANKSIERNSNVCSSLESHCEKKFRKRERGITFEIDLKNRRK